MATRKDKNRIVLLTGESYRNDGRYQYTWTDERHKRQYVYAKTLKDLRELEKEIAQDKNDKIKVEAKYVTLNDIFDIWKNIKRGIKDTTFSNYIYMYNTFVSYSFGTKFITQIQKSDVKRFYNSLVEDKGLKIATVDNIHNIIHQLFDLAVDDNYIRINPSEKALRELKQVEELKSKKKHALTKAEQDLFLNYIIHSKQYEHWYPIFAVMVGTGLRVGELTGLRWCDIDLEKGIINVNHTLVYYTHRIEDFKDGAYYTINSTKTSAGTRIVPMLDSVKEAFLIEKKRQEAQEIHCVSVIDGYSDFIFVNRYGNVHNLSSINKAIQRITRDCNFEQVEKHGKSSKVLLPHFSSHILRHSFATRCVEAGVSVKFLQDCLGHADISTTMNIYTDVTDDMRTKEISTLHSYLESTDN